MSARKISPYPSANPVGLRDVHNLATGCVEGYSKELSAEDALINAWMLGNRLASSLHDAKARESARAMIVRGSKYLGLGDFATRIEQEANNGD